MESCLIEYMIHRFVWGNMSAAEVQTIAALLNRDLEFAIVKTIEGKSVKLTHVSNIAEIGTSGAHPQNCHRDLMANLIQIGIAVSHLVELPLTTIPSNLVQMGHQCMIYPHELFASLYNHYHGAFLDRLWVSAERMQNFWTSVAHTQQFREHPVQSRDNFERLCIPLIVHSDGVPCMGIGKSWSKVFDIYSWGSMLPTSGDTSRSLFLAFGTLSKVCHRDTFTQICTILVWSFRAMWEGRWPSHHWDGTKYPPTSSAGLKAGSLLAGGFFCAIWAKICDLDNLATNLNLRNHGASETVQLVWCQLLYCTMVGFLSQRIMVELCLFVC